MGDDVRVMHMSVPRPHNDPSPGRGGTCRSWTTFRKSDGMLDKVP